MSSATVLLASRRASREREDGFTLIELLVVVIIIGILAAIAIPIYLGVTNGAKDSATKSDLTANKTAITGFAIDNNGLIPATVASDVVGTVSTSPLVTLQKYGWAKSTNTSTLTYTANGAATAAGTWCLQGTSSTTTVFYISTNRSVTSGACPASSSSW